MKPKIVVFAGPNGSGKSTITGNCTKCGIYINADEIKLNNKMTDIEAAVYAENQREQALKNHNDFSFETVLSTQRNLDLLRRAKLSGYFIRGFYVLTCSADINVLRVEARTKIGGHDVPVDKIRSRYEKALKLLPEFVSVCDICSIYDNSLDEPFRIYKKYHDDFIQPNDVWSEDEIYKLIYGKE